MKKYYLILIFVFTSGLMLNAYGQGNGRVLRAATTKVSEYATLQRKISPIMREQLLLERFAAENKMRLSIRHTENLEQLLKLLKEGKVDIIFANLTVTGERKKDMAFSIAVAETRVSIVTSTKNRGSGSGLQALENKNIFVIGDSSHMRNLLDIRDKVKGMRIVRAPVQWDIEEMLYMTGRGKIKYSIADDNFIDAYRQYRSDIKVVYTFPNKEYSAFAVSKSKPQLLASLNNFLRKTLHEYAEKVRVNNWQSIRRRGFIRVLTRNNPYSYFIHRGRLMGFEYELAKRFAQKHKLELIMVVPPSWQDMFEYLKDGRGDLIAAMMTVTDERGKIPGLSLCRPYAQISEQLIAHKSAPPVRSLQDLAGKNVAVRVHSGYYSSLKKLQKSGIAVKIIALPDTMETDEVLGETAEGKYPYTIVDSNIFKAESHRYPNLKAVFPLPGSHSYAWMTKTENSKLREKINEFFKSEYKSAFFNITFRKYFSSGASSKKIASLETIREGKISKFDPLIQKHAGYYSFPWDFIAAQIYQESRFNPNAKAWDGGMGLMQLMPRTAEELGCRHAFDPDENIKAGVKYMYRLRKKFKDDVPANDKMCFALASYNGGYGHVIDARRLAVEQGLDPNRWNGNVSKAFEQLSKRKYAKRARYGSCRSDIIINYVNNIFIRYYHYAQQTNAKPK
jgi:membrane-bound lytic murein transglycosylase F